jgi:hypothetical protein
MTNLKFQISNFKASLRLGALALMALLPCSLHAQIVTCTVVVTNTAGVAYGNTFSVNGAVRTWTNNVTSANNQLLIAGTIGGAATNLFFAYAAVPAPNVSVRMVGTNTVVFQGQNAAALAVLTNGFSYWCTLTFATQGLAGNWTVFRGNAAIVGLDELTNTANGIESFIASSAVTTAIPTNAKAMALFAPATAVAGFITGTAASNSFITGVTATNNFVQFSENNLYQAVTNHYELDYGAGLVPRWLINAGFDNLYDPGGVNGISIGTGAATFSEANNIAPNQTYTGGSSLLTGSVASNYFVPLSGGVAIPSYLGNGSALPQAILTRSGWQVFANGGTVTSIGVIGDSVTSGATPLGSPVTTAGSITLQPATANANMFVAGPASGSTAPLTQRAMVAADMAGLLSPQAFGTWTAFSAVTNFVFDFTSYDSAVIAGTGDVHFSYATNGPRWLTVTILGNADGTVRLISWPTNMITLNTTGLIPVAATNWGMLLTNNGPYRVAQLVVGARVNNPPDTNVILSALISP